MRNCRCFAACLAVVLGTAKALLAPQLAAAESISTTRVGSQVAVLFSGQAILGRQLPAFMQIQPGRLLNARTVEHACWAPGLRADGVLLFLPDSQHCELISPSRQISLRFRLQQLTGHWPLSDVTASIRNQPFVAIAPTGHTLAQATNVCGCLDNAPPDAIAMCSAQTRTAGT
ncbi:MAG: hypothetical protein ABI304_11640, partial [Rudaea sp.]